MKKKITFISFVITTIIVVLVTFNIKDITEFKGVLYKTNTAVNIKITRTNMDKIFNKISEEMIVKGKGIEYHYIFSKKIFNIGEYYAAPIRRMSETGLAAQGYLYFDDKMKNVAIETEQEIILSCEQEFFDMVIKH